MGPIILLQGPASGFMGAFAKHLMLRAPRGAIKVQYNHADAKLDRTPRDIKVSLPIDQLDQWYRRLFAEHGPGAVVLYEDLRPHHAVAISVCKEMGIPSFVFASGYVQPRYVTFEAGGTHGRSQLRGARVPRSISEEMPLPVNFAGRYAAQFRNATRYASVQKLGKALFGVSAPPEKSAPRRNVRLSLRAAAHSRSWRASGLIASRDLHDNHPGRYFIAYLQAPSDPELDGDPGRWTTEGFVQLTVESFARFAAATDLLVIKQSPYEILKGDWSDLVTRVALANGVGERVFYLRFAQYELLLAKARGFLTINSHMGFAALNYGCPVLCLGQAFYAREGLAVHGDGQALDRFWSDPPSVDIEFTGHFRRFVLATTQINGDFDVRRSWSHIFDVAGGRILKALEQPLPEISDQRTDQTTERQEDSIFD